MFWKLTIIIERYLLHLTILFFVHILMSLTGCLVTKTFGSLLLCGRALVKTQLIITLFKREAIKPPTKHIIYDGCNNTPDTRHVYKHEIDIHILELMLKRLFHKLQIISIREIWNYVQAPNRVGWLVNRFVKPYQQTITTVSIHYPVTIPKFFWTKSLINSIIRKEYCHLESRQNCQILSSSKIIQYKKCFLDK